MKASWSKEYPDEPGRYLVRYPNGFEGVVVLKKYSNPIDPHTRKPRKHRTYASRILDKGCEFKPEPRT